jgi:hypothetical protein
VQDFAQKFDWRFSKGHSELFSMLRHVTHAFSIFYTGDGIGPLVDVGWLSPLSSENNDRGIIGAHVETHIYKCDI